MRKLLEAYQMLWNDLGDIPLTPIEAYRKGAFEMFLCALDLMLKSEE